MHETESGLPPLQAGRQPGGRALLRWLDDERAPRLCRVSGSPGSGKSHLLDWLATAGSSPSAPAHRRPGAVISATGLSLDGATWLLARRLGVAARTPAELLDELHADDRPHLLFVRDLNRAAEPERIASELLLPLLGLPQVRAVVEAATGTPEAAALGPVEGPAVLDLDEPAWTDAARFARWYQRLGEGSPFDAGRLYRNPGLARLAATVPAGADASAGIGAAWWSALPEEMRSAVRALAAADRPVTLREWAMLPGAPDAASVGRAATLLPPDSPSGDSWWLSDGPVREACGPTGADHAAVAEALSVGVPATADGLPDWAGADQDLLGLLLRHAVRAGLAQPFLEDPQFLAYADPQSVTAAFSTVPHARFAALWRAAGPALVDEPDAGTRAAVLRTRFLDRDEAAAAALTGVGTAGWQADWAYWHQSSEPQLIRAALGRGPYAGHLLAADAEGTLQLIDLATGQPPVQFWPTPHKQLRSLTCLADGTVAALDAWGEARLLAGTGLPSLPQLSGCELSALSSVQAVGDSAGTVHWPAGGSEPLHSGPVTALDGVLPALQQTPLLLSGGLDGRVRTWQPGDAPAPHPVAERPCPVSSVALAELPDGLLTAVAWEDGLVRLRRLGDTGPGVELRLGSPIRTVLADATGRLILVMPDGVVGVTLR